MENTVKSCIQSTRTGYEFHLWSKIGRKTISRHPDLDRSLHLFFGALPLNSSRLLSGDSANGFPQKGGLTISEPKIRPPSYSSNPTLLRVSQISQRDGNHVKPG